MSSFIKSCGAIGLWNTGTFSKLVIMSVSCTCIFIVLTTLNMNFRILDQRPLSSMSRANTFVTSLKTMKRIDTLDKSMKRVLILTMDRSGSGLLGDVLDYHKDVVYYFEPLFTNEKILQQKFSTNKRDIKVTELLEEYLNCNEIASFEKFLFVLNALPLVSHLSVRTELILEKITEDLTYELSESL